MEIIGTTTPPVGLENNHYIDISFSIVSYRCKAHVNLLRN